LFEKENFEQASIILSAIDKSSFVSEEDLLRLKVFECYTLMGSKFLTSTLNSDLILLQKMEVLIRESKELSAKIIFVDALISKLNFELYFGRVPENLFENITERCHARGKLPTFIPLH
jgi:hypothetical protein